MDETAKLVLRVDSDKVDVANRRLDRFSKEGGQAERATDRLRGGFQSLIAPIAGTVSALAGLGKLVEVSRQTQVFEASLKTATGSAEGAAAAFEALEQFAATTPYKLGQSVEAFQKLVNLGLTPSEEALRSYGDTASAMGKDLTQMIEAVADATTGEFERLKEFGIKAKSEGDQVSFTFRGMTTTIGKNAAEIEQFLIGLGQNNFAGSMAERMATLDGALSNLADEWDKTFRTISEAGAGDLIEGAVRRAINVLVELNAMIASGQIQGTIEAIGNRFDVVFSDVRGIVADFTKFFALASEMQGEHGAKAVDFIVRAFAEMPENIKALMQLVGAEVFFLVDSAKATGEAVLNILKAAFGAVIDVAGVAGEAIAAKLNPFDDRSFTDVFASGFADAISEAVEKSRASLDALGAKEQARAVLRSEAIESILAERDATLERYDSEIEKVDQLREAYEQAEAEKRAIDEDRLAQFKFKAEEEIAANEAVIDAVKQKAVAESEAHKVSFSSALSTFDDFQDNILTLAKTGNSKMAKVYKAGAIASTIIKTYESAQNAYSSLSSIPYVGPALGAAAAAAAIAAGMARVSAIRNQSVGSYARGGFIPGSLTSGDQKQANVDSGEVILNAQQQRNFMALANGAKGGANINIFTQPGETARVEERNDGSIDVFIERAENVFAGKIAQGQGVLARSIERSFGLRRGHA